MTVTISTRIPSVSHHRWLTRSSRQRHRHSSSRPTHHPQCEQFWVPFSADFVPFFILMLSHCNFYTIIAADFHAFPIFDMGAVFCPTSKEKEFAQKDFLVYKCGYYGHLTSYADEGPLPLFSIGDFFAVYLFMCRGGIRSEKVRATELHAQMQNSFSVIYT